MKTKEHLYHFTKLSCLLEILRTRTLTLTSSENWEDENDKYFLEGIYKDLKGIKTVLSLCLTKADNEYHLWKIYGKEKEGVRIKFDKNKLETELKKDSQFKLKKVIYIKLKTLKKLKIKYLENKTSLDIQELPIYKRVVYRGEQEWRIIHESNEDKDRTELKIDSSIITEIKLNPWLKDEKEANSIKEIINKIELLLLIWLIIDLFYYHKPFVCILLPFCSLSSLCTE